MIDGTAAHDNAADATSAGESEDLPALVPPSADDHDETPPAPLPPPLTPADAQSAPRQRKKKRGRPRKWNSEAERREAAAKKRKDERDAEKALRAAEIAAGVPSQPGSDRSAAVGDPPAPDAKPEQPREVAPPDPGLAIMCGLGMDMAARYVPTQYGGGPLNEEERAALGSVWAAAIAPYLGDGPTSALMVAAVTTVQVFAVRAMQHQDQQRQETPPQRRDEPQRSAPAAETSATVSTPPARAEQPTPTKPAPRQTIAVPAKIIKVPQFTGED